MKRASTRRPGALQVILAAAAFVPVAALATHSVAGATGQDSAVALRLADGSFIRVACDRTASGASCPGTAPLEGASVSASPRHAPLKRRAQAADAPTPGVVAGVRG